MKSTISKTFAATCLAILANQPSVAYSQSVTFDEILQNPDNIKLNLQFARQEISSGRLQQAASALERLLLNRPNWDAVRLLYGTVLYRMDDLEGAKREFLELEGRQLSQKQEADRVKFLNKIEQANSTIRFSGHISIGGRMDSNPGLVSDRIADATVDDGSGFGDLISAIPGMNDAEDIAFLSAGRFRVENDLPGAPGSFLFFQVDGNIVDFSDLNRADALSGSFKAGVTLLNDKLTVSPYIKATQTSLQYTEFNNRWGAGVDVSYRASPRLTFFANGEFLNENFNTTSFSANNNQRDGDKVTGLVGATYRLTEKQSFTIAGFAADKESDVNQGYSYDQSGFSVNSLTLLGQGAYLSLSAKYSETDYEQPDGNFGSPFQTITREDERLFARAALGAPLQTISNKFFAEHELPEYFKDVVMQVGVSWNTLSSTSNVIEYENLSGDILFTKKFAF